jgi:superoxide oxidase
MKALNTTARYGWLSITLHWLMLALIVAVYGCILLSDSFPNGLKTWHFMLGLSVFALVWLRLIARWSSPTPLIVPAINRWQHLTARGLHIALYALMVAMPLLGWLILSAGGKPIPFFGLQLPALISQNKDWADLLKEIHETGAAVGYFLIGLHAAAALYHHYLLRDNTLARMLPSRKSGS